MTDGLYLLLGIGLLTLGGEALIRGAMAMARRYNVSPLLSGLVIVGFGTSAPELVVSVDAAIRQQPDIALGNVVGSNIGNVLLILGMCALIAPLHIHPRALKRDGGAVLGASVLFLLLMFDDKLQRLDGVLLLVTLAAYLIWAYRSERKAENAGEALYEAEADALVVLPHRAWWMFSSVILGIALLVVGSHALLKGAVSLAMSFGVSPAVVGLTLVAVGTSLPELWTSAMATLRGNADVAVGNILGSNIFNLLGILGVSALLQPLPAHARIAEFDQWVMVATAVLLMLFLISGRRLNRVEGALLVAAYGGYLAVGFHLFTH